MLDQVIERALAQNLDLAQVQTRVDQARAAAKAGMQAAELTAGAMRVSTAAETADAYLALRGLQARITVAQQQESTQSKLVELARQRAGQGLSSDRELQRTIGALEGVRACRCGSVARRASSKHRSEPPAEAA